MSWRGSRPADGRPIARPGLTLLVGILCAYVYGVVGYASFGFGVIDAVYMTALALTTAGIDPVDEFSGAAKVFTISLTVLGWITFIVVLAIVITSITERRLAIGARRRRMQNRVNALSNHFIVCAYGRVGRAVAREFESEGTPFVVLDTKVELEERMISDGVLYTIADPTQESVLRDAGAERARGLICAVDSDADNVYMTMTARAINPTLYIVARASEPDSPEHLFRAGADRVISPYVSSGRHMALLGLRPRVVDYLDIAGLGENKLRLEEILIEGSSPFVGATVAEVCGDAIPLLIRRNVGHLVPRPEGQEELEAGDLLVVVGEQRMLRPVEG